MNKSEQETLISVLNGLSKKIDKSTPNRLTDFVAKVAAPISTAGVIAMVALFTTTIPSMKTSIERVSWETQGIKEQLSKMGDGTWVPTREYQIREAEQKNEMVRMNTLLEYRGKWMGEKDTLNAQQNFRLDALEKKTGIEK